MLTRIRSAKKGEYHYRTGSTKQMLKGAALGRFLLSKTDKRWDSVLLPRVAVDDLDEDRLAWFRKEAVKRKRVPALVMDDDDAMLMERLVKKKGAGADAKTVRWRQPGIGGSS